MSAKKTVESSSTSTALWFLFYSNLPECYDKKAYGDTVLEGDFEEAEALPLLTGAAKAFLALELKDTSQCNKLSN